MAKKGMNPEAVEQMAQQITDAGDDALHIFEDVKGKVNDLDWTGEDRDTYVSQFEGDLQSAIQDLKRAADDLAERAKKNATEQRQASA